MRVIHWFRSDLRIEDNIALAAACGRGLALVPVFVLDDALIRRHREQQRRLAVGGIHRHGRATVLPDLQPDFPG